MRSLIYLTFVSLFFVSCDLQKNSNTAHENVSNNVSQSYEKFVDESLTLTLPHEGLDIPPAIVTLDISYVGKEGVENVFKENENLILNLIRTKIVNFSLKDLKRGDGLSRLEIEILDSVNGFVANDMFVKVQVSSVKEI